MNAFTPAVAARHRIETVIGPNDEHPQVTAGAWPPSAAPGSVNHLESPPIIFLDTLALDVREALTLIEQAFPELHRQAGRYFRLADVGEALAVIDQAGLLPQSKPGWYLRLQSFAGVDA